VVNAQQRIGSIKMKNETDEILCDDAMSVLAKKTARALHAHVDALVAQCLLEGCKASEMCVVTKHTTTGSVIFFGKRSEYE
jgi:alpha-D-ribose 1-methylphosphonate 5-triphosphate synthase subunit PhnG